VVKDVEELGAELNTHSLGNGCPLEYSEIEVVDAGSPEGCIGTRLAAEAPLWRGRKTARVEPLRDVFAASRFAASGYYIGTNIGDAQIVVL